MVRKRPIWARHRRYSLTCPRPSRNDRMGSLPSRALSSFVPPQPWIFGPQAQRTRFLDAGTLGRPLCETLAGSRKWMVLIAALQSSDYPAQSDGYEAIAFLNPTRYSATREYFDLFTTDAPCVVDADTIDALDDKWVSVSDVHGIGSCPHDAPYSFVPYRDECLHAAQCGNCTPDTPFCEDRSLPPHSFAGKPSDIRLSSAMKQPPFDQCDRTSAIAEHCKFYSLCVYCSSTVQRNWLGFRNRPEDLWLDSPTSPLLLLQGGSRTRPRSAHGGV